MTLHPASSFAAPRAAAAAAALLAFAAGGAHAVPVTLCPNSPSLGLVPSASLNPGLPLQPMSLIALTPGSTVALAGTNPTIEPQLAGVALVTEVVNFSFTTPSGIVAGTVTQSVVGGADDSCDLYWTVKVSPTASGKVARLQINGYTYKPLKPVYADWRNDLPGTIAPATAQRSGGLGPQIRFHIPGGIAAGQTSRRMFLDTQIKQADKNGTLRLYGVGGGVSAPIPTFVPSPP